MWDFLDQGSNPRPLHWQAESQPLHHQGSPYPLLFFFLNLILFIYFLQQGLINYLFYTYKCTYVNPSLPIHHTTTTPPPPRHFPPLVSIHLCPLSFVLSMSWNIIESSFFFLLVSVPLGHPHPFHHHHHHFPYVYVDKFACTKLLWCMLTLFIFYSDFTFSITTFYLFASFLSL